MAKAFHFGSAGRLRMLAGANLLADAVQITLGPHGRNVLIEHRSGGMAPVLTRDGITVARSIEDGDARETQGLPCCARRRGMCRASAGDGTSTTIVLARRIAAEAVKAMAAGMEPKGLRQGIAWPSAPSSPISNAAPANARAGPLSPALAPLPRMAKSASAPCWRRHSSGWGPMASWRWNSAKAATTNWSLPKAPAGTRAIHRAISSPTRTGKRPNWTIHSCCSPTAASPGSTN